MVTSDPRDLDVMELADLIREHVPDDIVPYVDELERRWFQEWATQAIERLNLAKRVAAYNEFMRRT